MVLVRAAEALRGAGTRAARPVASLGRGVRDDLLSFPVQPLPPIRRSGGRVRWLPHAAVVLYALTLAAVNTHFLDFERDLPGALAGSLAAVQTTAVLLAR